MSLPRYPRYKDSSVEWVGDVPAHWTISRLGFDCDTLVPMRDKPEPLNGEIPWIRIEDFDGKYISKSKSDQGVSLEVVRAMNLKVLPPGTVLCSCSCSMGATAIVASPLTTNQTFIGIVPLKGIASDYLYYLFHAAAEHLNSIGSGAIQTYLSRDDFRQLRLPRPSPVEQSSIAKFLDDETGKIDALVSEQRRLIELLKEKRQAVISHAVTKGLDARAPIKDYGLEWLDQVRSDWMSVAVKDLAKPGGKTFTDGDWVELPFIADSGVRLIQTGNVGIGAYKEQGFRYVSEESFDELGCTEIFPNDVLICRLDGPVGRACIVPDLGVRMITSVDNTILKVRADIDPRFVVYLMSSEPWLKWLEVICRVGGGFRVRVSRKMLGDLRIPCPPHLEQVEIADFLDNEIEAINSLMSQAQSAIELLQERRTALISAAVTGKIDVRGVGTEDAA